MSILLTGKLTSVVGKIGVESKNDAFEAIVLTHNGLKSTCLKPTISENEIIVESLCSIVGITLGIPIPTPIIVEIPSELLNYNGIVFNKYAFASEMLPFPNIHKLVRDPLQSEITKRKLRRYKKTFDAAAFDEFILNTDRHGGNILYNASDESFSFIDHGESLKNLTYPELKSPTNILLDLFKSETNISKRDLVNDLRDRILSEYNSINIPLLLKNQSIDISKGLNNSGIINYLTQRKNVLGPLVQNGLTPEQRVLL